MPTQYIGFDIYGTLVNPQAMGEHVRPLIGDRAPRFTELWREKQLEYAFRRAAMRLYEGFDVCILQALRYTAQALNIKLTESQQQTLIEKYQRLPAFADVAEGLLALKGQRHRLAAFSNGREPQVSQLLKNVGILDYFAEVVSVDDVKTFKPDPAVYLYLYRRLGEHAGKTWLVSSNPWDVIGAKSAGLRAVWVKRGADKVYDPWEIEPDFIIRNLNELPAKLRENK